VLELAQIPTGDLGDNVVQTGLEVGSGSLGNGIGELGQSVSETDLSGGIGKRVSGSLGRQSRRARETSVHLNDTVVEAIGLERVLDIALANDTQVTDDLDGSGTEHVVLLIRQSLGGSDNDTVTSVDTQRVKVLHVAHGDTVVISVANDLVLDLLPALEGLLDENLGSQRQGARRQITELVGVGSETRAETTKSIGGADNDGVTDLLGGLQSIIDGTDGNGLSNGDVDLVESLGEQVTVLTSLQSLDGSAENLDAVALEDTHAVHLHTQVESGLTTEGQEDTVGALTLDNVGDIFGGDGKIVDLVGQLVVGLDGRDIRVDQDGLNTSLLQSLESLRACISR
jgi:hypothetical protein